MIAKLKTIEATLRDSLGSNFTLKSTRPLSGGDICSAYLLDSSDGHFFVKQHQYLDFSIEADGLTRLTEAKSGLRVPMVIAHQDSIGSQPGFLVLEFIESGPKAADFDERFGRGLAQLHKQSHEKGFGYPMDTYCGATCQPNEFNNSWVEFYGQHRLGYLLNKLRSELSKSQQKLSQSFFERLPQLLDASQPPSLIHGDLWSGNLMSDENGRPTLIDPACYFAHREAELGMMRLFGGFSNSVYAAYEEVWPLPEGAEERNPIYQLYHLLNHACLFGGGYLNQACAVMQRYL